jgi:hypothetical protein
LSKDTQNNTKDTAGYTRRTFLRKSVGSLAVLAIPSIVSAGSPGTDIIANTFEDPAKKEATTNHFQYQNALENAILNLNNAYQSGNLRDEAHKADLAIGKLGRFDPLQKRYISTQGDRLVDLLMWSMTRNIPDIPDEPTLDQIARLRVAEKFTTDPNDQTYFGRVRTSYEKMVQPLNEDALEVRIGELTGQFKLRDEERASEPSWDKKLVLPFKLAAKAAWWTLPFKDFARASDNSSKYSNGNTKAEGFDEAFIKFQDDIRGYIGKNLHLGEFIDQSNPLNKSFYFVGNVSAIKDAMDFYIMNSGSRSLYEGRILKELGNIMLADKSNQYTRREQRDLEEWNIRLKQTVSWKERETALNSSNPTVASAHLFAADLINSRRYDSQVFSKDRRSYDCSMKKEGVNDQAIKDAYNDVLIHYWRDLGQENTKRLYAGLLGSVKTAALATLASTPWASSSSSSSGGLTVVGG